MSISEVVAVISAIVAILSLYYASKNNRKSDVKEIEERATQNAQVNVKLDNIANNIADIKYDISATKRDVASLTERMAGVESSVKSAHHRIDGIENRKDD